MLSALKLSLMGKPLASTDKHNPYSSAEITRHFNLLLFVA